MKTTQFITTLAAASLLVISPSILQAKPTKKAKNLVHNGDFSSSKLKMWLVGVTKKYGQELDHKVTKKTIHFKEIREMSPKYVTLGQYVDIQKGKTYQVSFDTKTSPEMKGAFNFNIGRPGFARLDKKIKTYDHVKSKLASSKDWKTTTITFTGAYDTDNKDYAGRKVKGADEKIVWTALDKETNSAKGPTWIVFNLGGVSGDVHIQNVVIKEVPKGADDGKEAKPEEKEEPKKDKKDEEAKDDKELTKEEKKAARKAEREKKKAEREAKKNKK